MFFLGVTGLSRALFELKKNMHGSERDLNIMKTPSDCEKERGRGRRVGLRSTVPSDRRSVAQIDRWTYRHTHRRTDRHTNTHTEKDLEP